MNNDLISREDLKKVLKECAYSYDGVNIWIMKDEVLGMIDNAPTVDFEKLGESLRCQIRAEYGSCDDCELSCPRNELIKLLGLARSQGEWEDYNNTFYKCPNCGYLLEKCCPECQTKVILPKGGAE